MLKAIFSKVVWLGQGVLWLAKGTSILVGLSVMIALTAGVVSQATAANGSNFILGSLNNSATAITRLVGNVNGPALQVVNPNTGASATAALFQVASGHPPFRVTSSTKVPNLNADQVDGKDSSQLKAICPAGTQSLGGACIENTVRGPANLATASSTCAGLGRRLPTSAELDSFRQQPNITIGVAGGYEWSGSLVVDAGTGAIAMTDAGAYAPLDKNQQVAFRCVASPS